MGIADLPIADINHEWQGYIPFDQLPSTLDPVNGIIATANSRITPEYYAFVTDQWGDPYRNERIWKRLPPEKISSPPPYMLASPDRRLLRGRPGARPALRLRHRPRQKRRPLACAKPPTSCAPGTAKVSIDSSAAAIVDAAKSCPLASMFLLKPKVGDDWQLYHLAGKRLWRLKQILTNKPAAWLPPRYKTWDDFLADLVQQGLTQEHAPSNLKSWRYGYVIHRRRAPALRAAALVQKMDGNRRAAEVRRRTTVKQVGRTFGPSQRFTIDWSEPDRATENISWASPAIR